MSPYADVAPGEQGTMVAWIGTVPVLLVVCSWSMPPQYGLWQKTNTDYLALSSSQSSASGDHVTVAIGAAVVTLVSAVFLLFLCAGGACWKKSGDRQRPGSSGSLGQGSSRQSVQVPADDGEPSVGQRLAMDGTVVSNLDGSEAVGLSLMVRDGALNDDANDGASCAHSHDTATSIASGDGSRKASADSHGGIEDSDSRRLPALSDQPSTDAVASSKVPPVTNPADTKKLETIGSDIGDRGRSQSEPFLDSPWPKKESSGAFALPGPSNPPVGVTVSDHCEGAFSFPSVDRDAPGRSASTEPGDTLPHLSTSLGRSHSFQVKPGRNVVPRASPGRRGSRPVLSLSLNPISKDDFTTDSKDLLALEKLSDPMTREQLLARNNDDIMTVRKEFWGIPMNQPERAVACSGPKNRYPTIFPNAASRVHLPQLDNDINTTYINANYISGYNSKQKEYIATQGPLSNTIGDFWRMVWHESVEIIVNMTLMKENVKSKCDRYWPGTFTGTSTDLEVENCRNDVGASCQYGHFTVCVVDSQLVNDTYVHSRLSLENSKCAGETRTVHHFWYIGWPDQGVPDSPEQLIELIKQVRAVRTTVHPVVVHCSAGIGRTGCFSAVDIGSHQLQEENKIDVQKIVAGLRMDRGGMVQTAEQYGFLMRCFQLIGRQQLQESLDHARMAD